MTDCSRGGYKKGQVVQRCIASPLFSSNLITSPLLRHIIPIHQLKMKVFAIVPLMAAAVMASPIPEADPAITFTETFTIPPFPVPTLPSFSIPSFPVPSFPSLPTPSFPSLPTPSLPSFSGFAEAAAASHPPKTTHKAVARAEEHKSFKLPLPSFSFPTELPSFSFPSFPEPTL